MRMIEFNDASVNACFRVNGENYRWGDRIERTTDVLHIFCGKIQNRFNEYASCYTIFRVRQWNKAVNLNGVLFSNSTWCVLRVFFCANFRDTFNHCISTNYCTFFPFSFGALRFDISSTLPAQLKIQAVLIKNIQGMKPDSRYLNEQHSLKEHCLLCIPAISIYSLMY